MENYLTLCEAADYFEVSIQSLKDQIRAQNMKASGRFICEDGEWFVSLEYARPLASEAEKLYYDALVTAKNDMVLSSALAQYCEGKVETNFSRIYQSIHRFTFKHFEPTAELIQLLKKYVNENSLFGEQIWA